MTLYHMYQIFIYIWPGPCSLPPPPWLWLWYGRLAWEGGVSQGLEVEVAFFWLPLGWAGGQGPGHAYKLILHTYIHTYIHTYTYMHIHTYIHTYIHTNIQHTYVSARQGLQPLLGAERNGAKANLCYWGDSPANVVRIPRLIGLWHGRTRQPVLAGTNSYPVSGPLQQRLPSCWQPFVQTCHQQDSRHGRRARRGRNMYRPNRLRNIADSFHLCTPLMRWNFLDHRHKLQHLILKCRTYQ